VENRVWPEPYVYTVYDRTYGKFPVKNTVYTPHIRMYVWFWPTLVAKHHTHGLSFLTYESVSQEFLQRHCQSPRAAFLQEPATLPHCHTATLPRCHTATLPHCHAATLPHCHTATLPRCHTATLLHCHTATLPHCHAATLPRCHAATLPHCHTALTERCPT